MSGYQRELSYSIHGNTIFLRVNRKAILVAIFSREVDTHYKSGLTLGCFTTNGGVVHFKEEHQCKAFLEKMITLSLCSETLLDYYLMSNQVQSGSLLES